MMISTANDANKNGSTPRTISIKFALVNLATVNSDRAKGGVMLPMQRFTIVTAEKCSGSIPIADTVGASSGTKSNMAELMSKKQPQIRNSTLHIIRNVYGELMLDVINCAS